MPNAGISQLAPESFTSMFEEMDFGMYNLQNIVSRKFESSMADHGDTVVVPLAVEPNEATDYVAGNPIAAEDIVQETVKVVLNKSKKTVFQLTDKELTLSKYELVTNYLTPHMEKLLEIVNNDIIDVMKTAATKVFYPTDGVMSSDTIIDCRKALDNNKAGRTGRVFVIDPDKMADMLKATEFKDLQSLGGDDTKQEAVIGRRYGFDFVENHDVTEAFAFNPSAIALAAKPYTTVEKPGVKVAVGDYKGIPIRVSIWTVNLVTMVQLDILYGVQLVHQKRIIQVKESVA